MVDRATRAPIPSAQLRALAPNRFAEVAALGTAGTADCRMAAATWELRLVALGYEPLDLHEIVVAESATTDLGELALTRGHGRITGRLRLLDPAPRFAWVELRGDGRSPCQQCDPAIERPRKAPVGSPICPPPPPESECCGWFPDRFVVEVLADGAFRFERLAAGTCFLRPLDPTARPQPTVTVAIAAGEQRIVDLTLAPPVELVLELFDADGSPFIGRWSADSEGEPPPIHTLLEFESLSMYLDLAPDAAAVRGRFGPPPREGLGPLPTPEWSVAQGAGTGSRAFTAFDIHELLLGQRIDRERKPDDVLEPVPPLPPFGGAEFAAARLSANRFRLRPLPAGRCRFTLTCADFASAPFDLDLATELQRTARVVLRRLD